MANLAKALLGAALMPKVVDAIKGAAGSGMLGVLPQKIADSVSSSASEPASADSGINDNLQGKMLKQKAEQDAAERGEPSAMKRGGAVKKMAKGGSVSSASKRADGCAQRGKTKGRMV
jgi:hypothetical protein